MTHALTVANALDVSASHGRPPLRLPPADDHTLWKHVFGQLKPSSRATYMSHLRLFAAWLGQPVALLPAVVVANDAPRFTVAVLDYVEHMDKARLAPSTKNVALAAIAWLVSALQMLNRIQWSLKVHRFKAVTYRDTAGPDEETVRAMLEVLRQSEQNPLKAARDEALVRLAVSMGLRRSEIVGLDLGDVDPGADGRPLRVAVLSKGADDKVWLTVPTRTAGALRTWLAYRVTLCTEPSNAPDARGVVAARVPLFVRCTHAARRAGRGERVSDEGYAHMLDSLRRRAGIEQRIRPHGLRHRSITSFLQAGGRLDEAVRFARHRDPKTTMIYRDNLDDAAGKAAETVDARFS